MNSTDSSAGSGKIFVTEYGENHLDYENPVNSFNVSIVVMDSGGLSDMCTVTVTVDDVNEPPTPNKTHTFWIRENAQKGVLVGYPILNGDPDIYDTHDYIITSWSSGDETYSNTDSAWHLPFMIQEGTGQMYCITQVHCQHQE